MIFFSFDLDDLAQDLKVPPLPVYKVLVMILVDLLLPQVCIVDRRCSDSPGDVLRATGLHERNSWDGRT